MERSPEGRTVEHPQMGRGSGDIALDGVEQVREHALAIAEGASRNLLIISRDLDPPLFDNQPFIDALSALARGHRMAHIRILLQDPGYIIAHGHRLLSLAQRLTTSIEIRLPGEAHRGFNEAMLIGDQTTYLRRPLADRYEGVVNYNDPRRTRELCNTFDELWTHATPDPQLRSLHL